MSGIAGYFGATQSPMVLASMVRKLVHRGPLGEEFHISPPVHMGARRISAADSGSGNQPVRSADKMLTIIFDGSIYNSREERKKLAAKGRVFLTQADAEVILALYEEYGVACVNHLRGMFAFALHDQKKNLVFMARDRMGMKPLYYATSQRGDFVFASEIKAIFQHPGIQVLPDMIGVDAYMSLGYSPGPESMFKGVHKLPAGHWMIWNPGLHAHIEPYWQWESFMAHDPALKTDSDFQEKFGTLFDETVKMHMSAGAAVGAFLSGSADSSAIVASMAKQSSAPVNTFSIGFDKQDAGLVEAQATAQHFGVSHHELICQPADMESLPELIWALDEPVADFGVVSMRLLSQFAHGHVGAILSGAGADEMLAGRSIHKTLLCARAIPKLAYKMAKSFGVLLPSALLEPMFGHPGRRGLRGKMKLVDFMGEMLRGSLVRQYYFMSSVFDRYDKKHLYDTPMKQVMETFIDTQKNVTGWPTWLSSLLALQQAHRLPDDILTRLDKMTMLHSLEGRAPFMDHKLAEFLLSVPDHLKNDGKRGKILLLDYAEKAMPGISARPTNPSPMPIEKFLSAKPLKEMVDICLSERSIRKRGLFDPEGVRHILDQLRVGDSSIYAKQVFSLLSLELWFRIYIDNEKGWISS